MKNIFIESVNRYSGLDDTRKEAIISLYSTLFEADETKDKKEEPKEENKEDNKEEKKEDKKDDKKADVVESVDGDFRIKRNLTPINVTPSRNRTIKYIALHYTAGASSRPGSASRTVFPGNCSAEFIVDDGEIYQFSPDLDNYYCQAVGVKKKDYDVYMNDAKNRGTVVDGAGSLIKSANNKNTISIEMCSNFNGTITKKTEPYDEGFTLSEATLANTAKLVSYLLQKYPDAQIVRHFDITGKPCPGPWTRDDKGTAIFNAFVERCKSTPPPDDIQFDDVEDSLIPKDEKPPWPDFGRFFAADKTATTKPDEDASAVSDGDVVNAIKKAVGNPIANTLIDVITKNSGKVSPYAVKDFVTMITQPKNKEMLKNVLKLVPNQ